MTVVGLARQRDGLVREPVGLLPVIAPPEHGRAYRAPRDLRVYVVGRGDALALLGERERLVVLLARGERPGEGGGNACASAHVARGLERRVRAAQKELGLLGVVREELGVGGVERPLGGRRRWPELREEGARFRV